MCVWTGLNVSQEPFQQPLEHPSVCVWSFQTDITPHKWAYLDESIWKRGQFHSLSSCVFRRDVGLHAELCHSHSGWLSAGRNKHRPLRLTPQWPELHRTQGPADSHGDLQLQQQQHLWVRGYGGSRLRPSTIVVSVTAAIVPHETQLPAVIEWICKGICD